MGGQGDLYVAELRVELCSFEGGDDDFLVIEFVFVVSLLLCLP